ncbi:MAG: grea/greb family elongation factor, transcription elongation factor GreA [Parcubacteria group bacterium]|nr:grea/greb family elongation factor, transcription elongation factor GreA [Parcubacteria group bacterium]
MNEREYLTQEKFDEFKKELEYLKHEKRTEIAKSLEYAKSLGDLSENAEYHEARDAQARVEDRINYLEILLKSATIVSAHDTSRIVVGTKVDLERESDKQKKSFTFVGSEEADAASGKISVRSPLGVAALGKAKGESFSFQTPSGSMTYRVLDIQ